MVTPLPDDEFAQAFDDLRSLLGLGPFDPFGQTTE